MSYNTSTIAATFRNLYSTLRRVYEQYAINYGARQYLLFANVALKKPDRIPFFLSAAAAQDGRNPVGNLNLGLSQYYFRERPLYFADPEAFMRVLIGKEGSYNAATNPAFIIMNVLVNGKYQDVYVPAGSAGLEVSINAMDAGIFDSQAKPIMELQKMLAGYIFNLIVAQNQTFLLEKAYKEGRYTNAAFLYDEKYGARPVLASWISSLQNDPRFIVKVCTECNGNAALGSLFPLPVFLTIAGAISLTWLKSSFGSYDKVYRWLEDMTIEAERLNISIERQWQSMNQTQLTAEEQAARAAVKDLAEVTITAQARPAAKTETKKSGLPVWVIPTVILLSLSLVGTQKAK